jgi:hypothetical protein
MNPSFETGLTLFRTRYIEYKKTGSEADRVAYEAAKKWVEDYLASLNTTVEQDRQRLASSVASYTSTNPDLTKLTTQMQTIRETAPAIQDAYITTKKRAEEVPVEDTTSYYAKGAIVVGLLGIVGAISLF